MIIENLGRKITSQIACLRPPCACNNSSVVPCRPRRRPDMWPMVTLHVRGTFAVVCVLWYKQTTTSLVQGAILRTKTVAKVARSAHGRTHASMAALAIADVPRFYFALAGVETERDAPCSTQAKLAYINASFVIPRAYSPMSCSSKRLVR